MKGKILIFILVSLALASMIFFRKCESNPENKVINKIEPVIKHHQVARSFEEGYRQAMDSTRKAMAARQTNSKKEYRNVNAADQRAELAWESGEIGCDSLIKSKNRRIKKGELLIARGDSLLAQDSLIIRSYAGTVKRQDLVIDTVGRKLTIEQQKFSREKNKRFGIGLQIGYGLRGPYIGAGLSINIWKF